VSTITKLYFNKATAEDIEWGIGTIAQMRGGKAVVLNKVNLASLPIDEFTTLQDLNDALASLGPEGLAAIGTVAANIAKTVIVADNIGNVIIVGNNVAAVNTCATNIQAIIDAPQAALDAADAEIYVRKAREAMNEPTGFNHDIVAELGIMELAVVEAPATTYTVHKIDQNNAFSKLTGQTNWGNGDVIDIANPYQFSIYPVDGITPVTWWIAGTKYTNSGRQTVIPDIVSGEHYFYMDATGLNYMLESAATIFRDYAVCAFAYGNATTGEKVIFANERHGIKMDGDTHVWAHLTQGTQYISGFGISGLAVGSSTYTQVDGGWIKDEDINILPGISTNTPFWYMDGDAWRGVADGLDLAYITNIRPNYNEYTGATWKLTEIGLGKYTLVHIFATNDSEFPVVKVLGQNEFLNAADAKDAALIELKQLFLVGLPALEFVPLYSIILNSSGNLTLTGSGDLYVDWRQTDITASQGSGDVLPSQAGNANKFLQTNGSVPSWVDVTYLNLERDKSVTHNMTSDAYYTLTPEQNKFGRIEITDTGVRLTSTRSIVVDLVEHNEIIFVNNTLQNLQVIPTTGTGVTVSAGVSVKLRNDGVNIINADIVPVNTDDRVLVTSEVLSEGQDWDGVAYVDIDAVGANPTAKIYPDGTISGSTDNDSYTKYPNGDLIVRINKIATTSSALAGNLQQSTTTLICTFPIAFISTPEGVGCAGFVSNAGASFARIAPTQITTTQLQVSWIGSTSWSSQNSYVSFIVKGKWK